MTTKLAEYCHAQRLAKGLSLKDLAVQIGYKNLGKGTNKLHQFETRGEVKPQLLVRVVQALGLDPVVISKLIDEDHQEYVRQWNEWVDTPIRPYLVIKLIPGIYWRRELPDDALEPGAAEEYARGVTRERAAKGWDGQTCLVMSRRLSIFFEADGREWRHEAQPDLANSPYMTLGRQGKPFVL